MLLLLDIETGLAAGSKRGASAGSKRGAFDRGSRELDRVILAVVACMELGMMKNRRWRNARSSQGGKLQGVVVNVDFKMTIVPRAQTKI